MHNIVLEEIPIAITWKKIKNLHLRVYPPDGSVKISAPLHMTIDAIRAFVISKIQWIKHQQKKLLHRYHEPTRLYVDGESHYLWGDLYSLKIIHKSRISEVQCKDDHLYLFVRGSANFKKKQFLMDIWYKNQVKIAAIPLIEKWEIQVGVKAKRIFFQKMKTRWGSCNTHKAHIRFNSELAKKPRSCLEYVVLHELVHLLEPSHNHRFKALMDKFMPDWRFQRSLLREATIDKMV